MARMIDAQILIEEIQSSLDIPSYSEHDKGFDDGLEYVLGLIEKAPTLTPLNEPLTMKELREMNGQPVWLAEEKVWALLQVWNDDNIDAAFLMPIGCFHAKSIIGTKIYRHPLPEPPKED